MRARQYARRLGQRFEPCPDFRQTDKVCRLHHTARAARQAKSVDGQKIAAAVFIVVIIVGGVPALFFLKIRVDCRLLTVKDLGAGG